jgi:hypothetical protein
LNGNVDYRTNKEDRLQWLEQIAVELNDRPVGIGPPSSWKDRIAVLPGIDMTAKKEELMKYHTGKLQEINAYILELLTDSLKDKKTDAVAKIKLLEFFKASGSVTHEASINMESKD